MKSIGTQYDPVKQALLEVTDNVGKGEAIDATTSHIVYMIDSEGESFSADNKKYAQVLQGSIDLFALPKDEHMFNKVQQALNEAEISFYFSSAQFEDLELNDFMHYEWIFEVS